MSTEHEVLAVAAALLAAWGRPPPPEVQNLIADDFTFWLLSGERGDRARFLAIMGTTVGIGGTEVDDVRVHVLGDAAVYSAAVVDRGDDGEGQAETHTRVTDVFARRAGGWQLVASHESIVGTPSRTVDAVR